MNKFITLLTFVLVVHHSLFAEESMTIKDNYTINSTAYMIPIEFKNSSNHAWSLNYNIWPRSLSNTYMLASESVPVFARSDGFYGNRAVYAGGPGHSSDIIEYFTISTSSSKALPI